MSLAIGHSPESYASGGCTSAPVELWCALFEESGRAFLLVFGCGTKAEEGSLQRLALGQAGIHSFVHRFERNSCAAIGALPKICFRISSARLIRLAAGTTSLIKPDAPGLLRVDHLTGKNELQGPAFSDQPRQPLRSAAARQQSQFDFRLAEFRGFRQRFEACRPWPSRSRRRVQIR